MHSDIFCHDVQSDAATRLLVALRCLVETLKDVGLIAVADATACVSHTHDHTVVLPTDAQGDSATVGGVLEGIGKQVGEYLQHLVGIEHHGLFHGLGQNLVTDVALLCKLIECLGIFGHKIDKSPGQSLQFLAAYIEFAEIKQLVDECQQTVGIALNATQPVCQRFILRLF